VYDFWTLLPILATDIEKIYHYANRTENPKNLITLSNTVYRFLGFIHGNRKRTFACLFPPHYLFSVLLFVSSLGIK